MYIQGYNILPIKTRQFGDRVLTGLSIVQQRPVWAIENARDWRIPNEGQLWAIANVHKCMGLKNNFQQRQIRMHRKLTVMNGNTMVCTGDHGKE